MPDISEERIYEALGLKAPDAGAQEQEAAEPAEDIGTDGENEQEVAEPAAEQEENEPESEETETGETMSREERARNAARRRQSEQKKAVEEALAAERETTGKRLKDLFEWAGFKDGETAIETLEQLEAYRKKVDENKLQKDLKAGKITREQLDKLVEEKAAEKIKAEQPEPKRNEEFEKQVEKELAEIRKYDPTIKSIRDFAGMDRAEEFFSEVADHNHSYEEAYRIVYADKIAEAKAKSEKQRAMNGIRSKDHLQSSGTRGAGTPDIPTDTMEYYRRFNPHATEEQIRKHYQNFLKGRK